MQASKAATKKLGAESTKTPPPAKADDSIDWSKVSEITIIEAEDYHD